MMAHALTVEDSPTSEDVQALSQGLTAHALPYTRVPGFQPLAVFLRDEQGIIVGGAWGHVNWNWLSVGLVWLSEALRGGGYGRQLMAALERAARERGCQYAHLDTFSWQARPFYERLGYETFAILDAYPPGQRRFFMKKMLIRSSSGSHGAFDTEKSEDSMTGPSGVSLRGAATVFVVQDVLRSVAHYRDVLGFRAEFTYGEPTFYAGVERDTVAIHLQASSETKRQPGHGAINVFVSGVDALYEELKSRGARTLDEPTDRPYGMRNFHVHDLDGNQLCFGMESGSS